MTRIAQLLEKARKERGLSLNKAAAELATSPLTYRQWVRGQTPQPIWVGAFAKFSGEKKSEVADRYIKDTEDRLRAAMGGYVSLGNLVLAATDRVAA